MERISLLEQRFAEVEKHATDDQYGIVRLSNSESATEINGLAIPTSELNPAVDGTLANKINTINESLANNVPKFIRKAEKTPGRSINFVIDYIAKPNEAYLISARSHVSGENNALYMLSYTTNRYACLTEIAKYGGMAPNVSVNEKTVTIDFWDNNGGGYSVIKLF